MSIGFHRTSYIMLYKNQNLGMLPSDQDNIYAYESKNCLILPVGLKKYLFSNMKD